MKIASLLATAQLGLTLAFAPALEARAPDAGLQVAIANPKRTPAFVKRDAVRHPREELEFFGLRPDMTVVEVDPGGVWTLPPTLAMKDKDREKYIAIGEADNYVLKFRKPKP
jgi:predicted methyltransferase